MSWFDKATGEAPWRDWVMLTYVEDEHPDHGFIATEKYPGEGMPSAILCSRPVCICGPEDAGKRCKTKPCDGWLKLTLSPSMPPPRRDLGLWRR